MLMNQNLVPSRQTRSVESPARNKSSNVLPKQTGSITRNFNKIQSPAPAARVLPASSPNQQTDSDSSTGTVVDNAWTIVKKSKHTKTFAEIVGQSIPKRKDAVENLLKVTNRYQALYAPVPTRFEPETEFKTRLMYVNGFSFIKIKDLRSKLYEMHFIMSKIYNIRWIGKFTLEFLIDESYAKAFEKRIEEFKGFINIAPTYDPRKCKDASNASVERQHEATRRFAINAAKIVATTNREKVKLFYQSYINSAGKKAREIADQYLSTAINVPVSHTTQTTVKTFNPASQHVDSNSVASRSDNNPIVSHGDQNLVASHVANNSVASHGDVDSVAPGSNNNLIASSDDQVDLMAIASQDNCNWDEVDVETDAFINDRVETSAITRDAKGKEPLLSTTQIHTVEAMEMDLC